MRHRNMSVHAGILPQVILVDAAVVLGAQKVVCLFRGDRSFGQFNQLVVLIIDEPETLVHSQLCRA